jgi:AraC-like DNA-binding protein
MKTTASGRILIWQGGSLWIGRAGDATASHAHHAVQIGLPFSDDGLRFRREPGRWMNYPAAMIRANEPHAFEATGQLVAQIFVEPESLEGRLLQRRFADQGIATLDRAALQPQVAALAGAFEARAGNAELIALARETSAKIAGSTADAGALPDARITRAVALIRERLADTIPLSAMAAAANLSPDRFRHLFMRETGVGFRAYLLWQRLDRALAAYIAGNTLTEAAYIGGFADSAHFSRTFKRMFGIAPASIRLE